MIIFVKEQRQRVLNSSFSQFSGQRKDRAGFYSGKWGAALSVGVPQDALSLTPDGKHLGSQYLLGLCSASSHPTGFDYWWPPAKKKECQKSSRANALSKELLMCLPTCNWISRFLPAIYPLSHKRGKKNRKHVKGNLNNVVYSFK